MLVTSTGFCLDLSPDDLTLFFVLELNAAFDTHTLKLAVLIFYDVKRELAISIE